MGGSNSFAIKILGFWVALNKQPFIQKRLDCKITDVRCFNDGGACKLSKIKRRITR
jgi:hypothetical protein